MSELVETATKAHNPDEGAGPHIIELTFPTASPLVWKWRDLARATAHNLGIETKIEERENIVRAAFHTAADKDALFSAMAPEWRNRVIAEITRKAELFLWVAAIDVRDNGRPIQDQITLDKQTIASARRQCAENGIDPEECNAYLRSQGSEPIF